VPIEANENSELKEHFQKITDKIDAITADGVVTKQEMLDYAETQMQVFTDTLKFHNDALESQRQYYEDEMRKHDKNTGLVMIGFLGTVLYVMISILASNGIGPGEIFTSISVYLGMILSVVLALQQKGYLNGSTWIFLANFFSKIIKKQPLPEKITDAIPEVMV
jgi:hypothetical protein